jgi:phage tail sheath gpL-like
MGQLNLQITTRRDDATLKKIFETPGAICSKAIANKIAAFIASVMSGTELGPSGSAPSIAVSVDGQAVAASGTVTFTGTGAANDTILINGVTFTAVASGATGNQWNVGGSATLSAAALAAAINASASALVSQQVSAASVAGVVTITSKNKGVYGNAVTIAEGVDAGGAMAVSGARLTAGAADASAITLSF